MIICHGQSPFVAWTPPTILETVWFETNGLRPQLFAFIEYISFVLSFYFHFGQKNVFFLFNCLVKKANFFQLEIEIVDAVVGNVDILVVAVVGGTLKNGM